MSPKRIKVVILLCVSALLCLIIFPLLPFKKHKPALPQKIEGRILVAAKINGNDVVFAYDTCTPRTVIFRDRLQELGLEVWKPGYVTPTPGPGRVNIDTTYLCDFSLSGSSVRRKFFVADDRGYAGSDVVGLLSCKDFPTDGNVVQIDALNGVVKEGAVPQSTDGWSKWHINPYSDYLVCTSDSDTKPLIVVFDTGSPEGVMLGPKRKEEFLNQLPAHSLTMANIWTLAEGRTASEMAMVHHFELGKLVLSDIPVRPTSPWGQAAPYGDYDAILGIAALKQMLVVIDRKNMTVYTRPNGTPPASSGLNALGAEFILSGPRTTGTLLARVAPGGPAEEAGMHDNDVLLEINGHNIDEWRGGAGPEWPDFSDTKKNPTMDFTLKRQDTVYKAHVQLRQPLVVGNVRLE